MEQELENIDHPLPAGPDSLSKTIPDEVFGRDKGAIVNLDRQNAVPN